MSTGGIVHLQFYTVCLEDYVTVLFSKIFCPFFFFLKSTLLSHNQLFFHWPCVKVHRKHIYSLWYRPLSGLSSQGLTGAGSREGGQCHPVLRYPELWKGVEDAGAPRVPVGIWEAAA